MPPSFLHFNLAGCSNTLFSNTSALTTSLLLRANSTRKILEHLVWSNTSGFRFWGPLARTNFLSALCGPPIREENATQTYNFRAGSQAGRHTPGNLAPFPGQKKFMLGAVSTSKHRAFLKFDFARIWHLFFRHPFSKSTLACPNPVAVKPVTILVRALLPFSPAEGYFLVPTRKTCATYFFLA